MSTPTIALAGEVAKEASNFPGRALQLATEALGLDSNDHSELMTELEERICDLQPMSKRSPGWTLGARNPSSRYLNQSPAAKFKRANNPTRAALEHLAIVHDKLLAHRRDQPQREREARLSSMSRRTKAIVYGAPLSATQELPKWKAHSEDSDTKSVSPFVPEDLEDEQFDESPSLRASNSMVERKFGRSTMASRPVRQPLTEVPLGQRAGGDPTKSHIQPAQSRQDSPVQLAGIPTMTAPSLLDVENPNRETPEWDRGSAIPEQTEVTYQMDAGNNSKALDPIKHDTPKMLESPSKGCSMKQILRFRSSLFPGTKVPQPIWVDARSSVRKYTPVVKRQRIPKRASLESPRKHFAKKGASEASATRRAKHLKSWITVRKWQLPDVEELPEPSLSEIVAYNNSVV